MNLEEKRKKIELAVKIGALLLVGFIVAPFIFVAIQGIAGLLVAGTIGAVAINLAPWAAAKVANWRIMALKHEAARNPVETLQNDYLRKQESLKDFGAAITTFSAKVSTFADKLVDFRKQYPEEVEKFNAQHGKMRQLLELRRAKYKSAQAELARYEDEIQKAGAIWQMGQAAAEMTKAAGMTEEDFLAKIQVETALDSVQAQLNVAFSDLEQALTDEDDKTADVLAKQNASATRAAKSESTTATPTPTPHRL